MQQILTEIVNDPCSGWMALTALLLSVMFYFYTNRNLPPGPVGFPYLGCWPYLHHDTCHLELAEWGKKYGDVFSFRYTGRLFINLGSAKVAREAHLTRSDCFAERIQAFNLMRFYLNNSIFCLESEKWRIVRKFLFQQLRERSMNTIQESLSGPIYRSINRFVTDLKTRGDGQMIEIGSVIRSKTNEIFRLTLFGNDGITEKELRECDELYQFSLRHQASINLLLTGNIAKCLIRPFPKWFLKGKRNRQLIEEYLERVIQRRKKTFDKNNIRDCLDAFFNERLQRNARNDPTHEYFQDKVLLGLLFEIVDDSVSFLTAFISLFLKAVLDHPEEQEKIYQELMDVVGPNRNIEIEDRNKLTYTNAFITEVMRTSNFCPVFPSLECTKETTVGGYRIPKGAITVYSFWMAHMNPRDYEEPERFKPSRFISKDGQTKPDFLSYFGVGKRSCVGEGYVMIQVFLYLTTILKHFRLTRSEDMEAQNTSRLSHYDDFYVCIHSRK